MSDDAYLECPMCGTDFVAAGCHSSCPISRGCEMSRCPRCFYEFVGTGRITRLLTSLFKRRSHDSRSIR